MVVLGRVGQGVASLGRVGYDAVWFGFFKILKLFRSGESSNGLVRCGEVMCGAASFGMVRIF